MARRILQRLGFQNDPFVPDVAGGQPINPKLFDRALDPEIDPRVLNYYYDVYHWSDETLIGNLDPIFGLGNFPAPDDVDDPILIIVSGTEDTGRASLVNLIRHAIRRVSASVYEIESFEDSRHAEANVKTIAMNFIANWHFTKTSYTTADLTSRFQLYTANPSSGTKTHYPDLFRYFRKATDACGIDSVVVIVRKTDSFDVWSVIYYSVASLAKYVIVETTKPEEAEACYDQITKDNGNAVLMDARRLDLQGARKYLTARLQSERQQPHPDPIWPFTEQALAALYKPGSKPQAGGVRWPIGSLRGMLRATFDRHVLSLNAAPKPPNQLTDPECCISEELALEASTEWQGSKKKKK